MSGKVTLMGDVIAAIVAGNPGARLKAIEYDSFSAIKRIEWHDEPAPAEAGTSPALQGAEPSEARVPGAARVAAEDRAASVHLYGEAHVSANTSRFGVADPLSSLPADQLADEVRSVGFGWYGSIRRKECEAALAELCLRLKTAEDALEAERHRAVEAESRLIAAIRPNPKP